MLPQSFPIQKELLLSHNGPVHTKETYKSRDHFWSDSKTSANNLGSSRHSAGKEQDAFLPTTSLTHATEGKSATFAEDPPGTHCCITPCQRHCSFPQGGPGTEQGGVLLSPGTKTTTYPTGLDTAENSFTYQGKLNSNEAGWERQWHGAGWRRQLREQKILGSGHSLLLSVLPGQRWFFTYFVLLEKTNNIMNLGQLTNAYPETF